MWLRIGSQRVVVGGGLRTGEQQRGNCAGSYHGHDLTMADGILKLSAVFDINHVRRPVSDSDRRPISHHRGLRFSEAVPRVSGLEYEKFPLPPDYQEKTEWVFARLMYPPVGRYYGGYLMNGDWKQGGSNWTMDYPRSDRHFSTAVRRLTRISARSVEEPIDLDDRDVYDWPWLYGVEVGHWDLTDEQAKTMREFLLRGGFFMCDDFHGDIEWSMFFDSMQKYFPTGRSWRFRITTRSSAPSTIFPTAIRCPACPPWRRGTPMKRARAAKCRTGAESTTTTAALS